MIGLLAAAIAVGLAAATAPYLPIVHGTTDDEIERLVAWLQIQPGSRVADLGAGEGTFALALAQRVGPSGHLYATEIDQELIAALRGAVTRQRLANVTVIEGSTSSTNLPDGCCDALFSRNVYHHLTDAPAINKGAFRALRPGARLLVIDFEPGGVMDLIGGHADRDGGHGTAKETVVREVSAAGFQLARGPETWRGRMYALLFTRP